MKLTKLLFFTLVISVTSILLVSCESDTTSSSGSILSKLPEFTLSINETISSISTMTFDGYNKSDTYTTDKPLPSGLSLKKVDNGVQLSGTPDNNRDSNFNDLTKDFVIYLIRKGNEQKGQFKLKLQYTRSFSTPEELDKYIKNIMDTNDDSTIDNNTPNLLHIDIGKMTSLKNVLSSDNKNNIYGNFNGIISGWDTSNITNMKSLFGASTKFNDDISKWNVNKVTDMTDTFVSTSPFNKNLSKWNVDKVIYCKDAFKTSRNKYTPPTWKNSCTSKESPN